MRANQVTAIVLASAITLLSVVAWGAEPDAAKAPTVESVQKGIVGVWNGVWDDGNTHVSYVLSFDAQGRITEKGFAGGGGMLLGSAEPRQGKVKYRLEPSKGGAGVVIVEIDANGTACPIYVVEQMDEKIAKMRAIDSQTKKPTALVEWKRVQAEPYEIKAADLGSAAESGDLAEVRRLLAIGAGINDKSGEREETALVAAASGARTEVVKALLKEGADVNTRNKFGQTALIVACMFPREPKEVVGLLLGTADLDLDARDDRGSTALIVAAYTGQTEVVRMLLQKGADVSMRSSTYGTALECATKEKRTAIVDLLKNAGTATSPKTAQSEDSALPLFEYAFFQGGDRNAWKVQTALIGFLDTQHEYAIKTAGGRIVARGGWTSGGALFNSPFVDKSDPPKYLLKDEKTIGKAKEKE